MADIKTREVVTGTIKTLDKSAIQAERFKNAYAKTRSRVEAAIKKNADAGKGIFAMKAFGGGVLVKNYIEALDYVSGIEGMDSIMLGFGTKEQVDRAIEYAEGTIDRSYVPDMTGKKIRVDQGDCEGCGACIDRCPNHAIFRNENGLADVNHDICMTCGYCAPVCPVRAIIML